MPDMSFLSLVQAQRGSRDVRSPSAAAVWGAAASAFSASPTFGGASEGSNARSIGASGVAGQQCPDSPESFISRRALLLANSPLKQQQQRISQAEQLKNEGNTLMQAKNYEAAIAA